MKMDAVYKEMSKFWKSLLFTFLVLISLAEAQDDMGGGEEVMDMESMGMDSQPTASDKDRKGGGMELESLTYIEQSTRALQQLALVIGVAFMVAFLFLVMVGLEKAWDNMQEKYKKSFGKETDEDVDPASLVGTFKRYK